MLDAEVEQEIEQLSQQYGQPIHHTATLINVDPFDPIGKADRYGEVCLVLRLRNGRLLTARKTFYPPEAYRLLTGGIRHGEPIFQALLRETEEETGLDVNVTRFLAAVSYTIQRPNETIPGAFWTFAFLLDEMSGTLACADPDERVADYREVAVDELPVMADRLDHLARDFDPEISGRWHDWGQFRAVIHRVVHEALREA